MPNDREVHGLKTAKNSGVARPERIILGIDPGTTVMGYGVIRAEGPRITLVEAGSIRFSAGEDHTLKLRAIHRHTTELIERHLPDDLAIEAQFFGKNVQSMLKLGRAQGVAIAAAIQREVAVREYAPTRIKQSITGHGGASKEQVAAMLLSILGVAQLPPSTDATDALAVAVCHQFNLGHAAPVPAQARGARSGGGWAQFVRNNPGRVKP
ncbi:MAG: crossover junction endodeoxyribonuclease RuvC [Flavobacteriales bacterium]|nr:Crossover junction endodeoxyribonuclease RuvC [Flavobacteriales bacterium]MCC6577789.1 crossover junction endodeoxyribonuclease RuvC [Flavobacteriales bacterium]NUQ15475.1 crossover junction endodeoxyribonuclease RuvC [Flavobacteriales bacterium]